MSSLALKVWLSILLLGIGVYGSFTAYKLWAKQHSRTDVAVAVAPQPEPEPGDPVSLEETSLIGTDGKPYEFKELEGRVWVASFFFSACPGTCAQMNRSIAALEKEFKDQDVTFVSISCDPQTDTPEVLKTYAKSFNANPQRWKFLTGDFELVQSLGKDVFKVPVDHRMHSERMILIDRQGRPRGTFNALNEIHVKKFREAVAEALAEEPVQVAPEEEGAEAETATAPPTDDTDAAAQTGEAA